MGRRADLRTGDRVRPPVRLARRAARPAARAGLPPGAVRLVGPAVVERAAGRAVRRGGPVAGPPRRLPADPPGPRRAAARPDPGGNGAAGHVTLRRRG